MILNSVESDARKLLWELVLIGFFQTLGKQKFLDL